MIREEASATGGKHAFTAARWIYLRAHGAILVIAFVSLWTQIHGLVGSRGILPAEKYFDAVREAIPGASRYFDYPAIFWLTGASDGVLSLACALGAVAGFAVIAGRFTRTALVIAWILYLSLSTVARVFLGFQWDILLLESTIAALFLAGPKPGIGGLAINRLLLFKLVFSSGLLKLTSGDETWRNGTALLFHYETQPLPTVLGWYAHQLPDGVQAFSVVAMFVAQLAGPILLFLPRPARLAGVVLVAGHQLLIAATGNYCFFNLATLALCVLFVDDAILARVARRLPAPPEAGRNFKIFEAGRAIALAVLVVMNGLVLANTFGLSSEKAKLPDAVARFRSVNSYGLFRVMTTTRNEIIIEGSDDGQTWLPYTFKHQPGDVTRAPTWVAPHQPRLDWQMWFAALGTARQNPWFTGLLVRLFENSPDVLGLIEKNPFPDRPPQYLRAELYLYHFTNAEERSASGAWWKREYLSPYFPAVQNNAPKSAP